MANSAPNLAIQVWRNTNDPSVCWEHLQADGVSVGDMAEDYELNVYWPGQVDPMVFRTNGVAPALTMDRTTGRLYWAYAVADTLRIPLGGKATYEMFGITSGHRRFWYGGTVTAGTYRQ